MWRTTSDTVLTGLTFSLCLCMWCSNPIHILSILAILSSVEWLIACTQTVPRVHGRWCWDRDAGVAFSFHIHMSICGLFHVVGIPVLEKREWIEVLLWTWTIICSPLSIRWTWLTFAIDTGIVLLCPRTHGHLWCPAEYMDLLYHTSTHLTIHSNKT